MKKAFTFIFIFLFEFTVSAQLADRTKNAHFVAASFSGVASIDTIHLTANGVQIVIAKYDPSGDSVWEQKSEIGNENTGIRGCGDSFGNTYIAGYFIDTVTFGSKRLTSKWPAIYLAKFNSSGICLWAKNAGESDSTIISIYTYRSYSKDLGIRTDSEGNVYITGNFYSPARFGSTMLIPNGKADTFIAKCDSMGIWQWANHVDEAGDFSPVKQIKGNTGAETIGRSISADTHGNTYNLSASGEIDLFVTWLNADLVKTEISSTHQPTNLSIFINPNKGLFFTDLTKTAGKHAVIQAYTIEGKLVLEKPVDESIAGIKLDLSAFSESIYFLKVLSDQASFTSR